MSYAWQDWKQSWFVFFVFRLSGKYVLVITKSDVFHIIFEDFHGHFNWQMFFSSVVREGITYNFHMSLLWLVYSCIWRNFTWFTCHYHFWACCFIDSYWLSPSQPPCMETSVLPWPHNYKSFQAHGECLSEFLSMQSVALWAWLKLSSMKKCEFVRFWGHKCGFL